jgi:protein-arginine kinase activator protein McsA
MKAKTEPTIICPNCYSTKTYPVRPGVTGCASCSARWERR